MKNAIILHGKPGKEEYYDPFMSSMSNAHWLPWLQGQLLKHDIAAATPEVPYAFEPDWELWVKEVERFEVSPDTILVGHSCGAGFWVKWLSLNKNKRVGKVILVAPSLGYDWSGSRFFSGLSITSELIKRTAGITIFESDNDKDGIRRAASEIRKTIPEVKCRLFPGYGHFTSESMKTTEFPELLDEVLGSAQLLQS